jgi:hypothetical protein
MLTFFGVLSAYLVTENRGEEEASYRLRIALFVMLAVVLIFIIVYILNLCLNNAFVSPGLNALLKQTVGSFVWRLEGDEWTE